MIRRRLVLAISATVALAIVVGSYLATEALEDRLVDDIDEQFVSGRLSDDIRQQLADRPRFGRPGRGVIEEQRELALALYDRTGRLVQATPAGTDADPVPLPDPAEVDLGDGIRTVGSVDGGPRYRAVALETVEGGRMVIGVSLAGVDETVDEARRILRVVGAVAIVASGVLCWWFVRRAFAPIDGMIATAGRIAAGDLAERTDLADDGSEVGRLGHALDRMLDRIEVAVADRTASEERMRRFVADASHDLRTPLTSVRGYAELYRQGADDPAVVAESMTRIEGEATRMSRLVEDLMLLARLDQHRPVAREPVDLGRVAGEAVDTLRVVDGDRTYDLDAPSGIVVAGDADQLRQVLDNLLANARAHTPAGTTVDVTLRTEGDQAVLVVADDGPGIADADRERVFDRFWRPTRADEDRGSGSGLGLSIVSSIVTAHDGSVTLDRSPAGGARFTVRLPVPTSRPPGTPGVRG